MDVALRGSINGWPGWNGSPGEDENLRGRKWQKFAGRGKKTRKSMIQKIEKSV